MPRATVGKYPELTVTATALVPWKSGHGNSVKIELETPDGCHAGALVSLERDGVPDGMDAEGNFTRDDRYGTSGIGRLAECFPAAWSWADRASLPELVGRLNDGSESPLKGHKCSGEVTQQVDKTGGLVVDEQGVPFVEVRYINPVGGGGPKPAEAGAVDALTNKIAAWLRVGQSAGVNHQSANGGAITQPVLPGAAAPVVKPTATAAAPAMTSSTPTTPPAGGADPVIQKFKTALCTYVSSNRTPPCKLGETGPALKAIAASMFPGQDTTKLTLPQWQEIDRQVRSGNFDLVTGATVSGEDPIPI